MNWYQAEVERQRWFRHSDTYADVAWKWGHATPSYDRTVRLFDLLTAARNFSRLMGVPKNTDIRMASYEELGTACAGFYDGPPKFAQPFMLIDEGVFNRRSPADAMDIAIGLSIHESIHILVSRDCYVRQMAEHRDQRLNVLDNLVEDWRIEVLCSEDFPGYAPYLYKLRRVLIVDESLANAIRNWQNLCDVEKILTITTAYMRAPDAIAENRELREWNDLQDRNIFKFLLQHMSDAPRTEEDVERMSLLILYLIDDYRNQCVDYLTRHNKWSIDAWKRLEQQMAANSEETLNGAASLLGPLRRGRFSISDLRRAKNLDSKVRKGSSASTLKRIRDLEEARTERADDVVIAQLPQQILPAEYRGQIEFVKHSGTEEGRKQYEKALAAVRSQVSRLKHIFKVEDGTCTRNHLTEGKLNRREIYRANFDNAIFTRTSQEGDNGRTDVSILIDASGSMEMMHRYKRAIEMAAMFNEAFLNHPNIKLYFYSHTTDATGGRCHLCYHGPVGPSARASLGAIQPRESNLDYQAIWGVVADRSREKRSEAKQILLVLSDGRPCTPTGHEGSGIMATKHAIENVRRRNWKVYGIGIGGAMVKDIYGDRWSLLINECSAIPSRMSHLLIRLLRS